MERYIKYKRFEYRMISPDEMQENFDDLITKGWEIISYNEERIPVPRPEMEEFLVVIVAGKRQESVLGMVL